MPTDYYALLGVAPNASADEIKRAYRRLARELHPDANPDPAAVERFKEVTLAYETLSDPERRRRYDVFGPDGERGPAGGGEAFDLGDIFSAVFGGDAFGAARGPAGPARAADAETVITLDLSDAAFGTTRTVELRMAGACERCAGSGCEPGTHPERCTVCEGTGQVRQVRRSILGQLVTAAPCAACGATGSVVPSPCRDCRGDGRVAAVRSIDVEVPAGIDDGQRLRLAGRGPAAPRAGVAGDLYVAVRVRPDPRFERHGDDLLHVLPLAMTQAALGTTVSVETLDGEEELRVPPGTQPGRVFTLRGRGVPALRGRRRGDLHVQVEVRVPESLSEEESGLLEQFAALRGEEVGAPGEGGFFSKLRSAFQ